MKARLTQFDGVICWQLTWRGETEEPMEEHGWTFHRLMQAPTANVANRRRFVPVRLLYLRHRITSAPEGRERRITSPRCWLRSLGFPATAIGTGAVAEIQRRKECRRTRRGIIQEA